MSSTDEPVSIANWEALLERWDNDPEFREAQKKNAALEDLGFTSTHLQTLPPYRYSIVDPENWTTC